MKLTSYYYEDIDPKGFKIGVIEFKNLNLIVGYSGSGKTRLLHTIFNLARAAGVSDVQKTGYWKVEFLLEKKLYCWELRIGKDKNGKAIIELDNLKNLSSDQMIIDRNENSFEYKGNELPQLKNSETSLSILRNEDEINPIHLSFSKVLRRSFSHDYDTDYLDYEILNDVTRKIMQNSENVFDVLLHAGKKLNIMVHVLKEKKPEQFKLFEEFFKEIFPNIEEIDVKDISFFDSNLANFKTPIICVKEKNVDNWIEFKLLSSGIQKVIIIMTDILFMGSDWLYLIDEYENSLGPKIIDFFYSWIQEINASQQYIITSHHPYVINNIPLENWYVCTRKGSVIDFIYGEKLEKIIGKSNQTAFTKLLNSPLYNREI